MDFKNYLKVKNFESPHYKFINEAYEMLDVSILSVDKYITSTTRLENILYSEIDVEEKTDGVKLTIYKIQNNGDISDWIFSYKNHILYPDEYNYQPDAKIASESIGASQFKKVFDRFRNLGKTSIPVGTELQCEFLMRKPTLSSNYLRPHGIVLIQYSKSKINEDKLKFGVFKSEPLSPSTSKRDEYASELRIRTPLKLFHGILGYQRELEKGIINKDLKDEYNKERTSLVWNEPEELFRQIKQMFLNVPSAFGGKEEGVVIKLKDGTLLKLQQSYQLDKAARDAIKQKYKEPDEAKEKLYWERVQADATRLANMVITNNKNLTNLPLLLNDLSDLLRRFKPDYEHSKKTLAMIKDDIQLNAKTLIIKNLKGNNNCLMLGKFRIFTNGHLKVLKSALKDFDNVCICLVTSKDTKETRDLRLKALQKVTDGNPRVKIIEANSGNLIRICSDKAPFNINAVYTGSDRVSDYLEMLKHSIGMSVKEIHRTESDISATKMIEGLSDRNFFEKNTPKELHNLYDEYMKAYNMDM